MTELIIHGVEKVTAKTERASEALWTIFTIYTRGYNQIEEEAETITVTVFHKDDKPIRLDVAQVVTTTGTQI